MSMGIIFYQKEFSTTAFIGTILILSYNFVVVGCVWSGFALRVGDAAMPSCGDAMCAQWPCDVIVVMRCVVTQCVMSGVAIAMWWRNVATSCGMRGYLPWYVRDVGNASVSFGLNACIVCSCGWLWFIWWYFFPVQYYILIWWYPDSAVMGSPVDTVKMLIPATIYAIQNNLLFIALSNLNATSYPFCCRGEVFFSLLYAIQTPFHPFEFFTTPPLLESSFIFIFVKCSLLLV